MKYIFKLLFSLSLLISLTGCKGDETEYKEPQVDLTQENILGTWQLELINGEELEGDNAYFYITLKINELGATRFEIYENMATSFANFESGLFEFDAEASTISGEYDLSYGERWSNDYNITSLTAVSMVWSVMDGTHTQSFVRVGAIPEAILNGSRAL